MAGGASLVVFRASKHKAAARKLIEFLSEPAQQVRFYELTGDLPARRSAWHAPALANDPHFPRLPRAARARRAAAEGAGVGADRHRIFDRGEAAVRGAHDAADGARRSSIATADAILEKRRWMLRAGVDARPACPSTSRQRGDGGKPRARRHHETETRAALLFLAPAMR